MTTPASNTAYGIIYDALLDAGKRQPLQTPGSEQLASCLRRLNDIVNLEQTQGLKLFVNVDTPVPLVAGQQLYTFGPAGDVVMTRPLRVLEGYYLYTTTNVRRPFIPLAWRDYLTLGQSGTQASNQGTISQYFTNKLATEMQVVFWLCPDSTEVANGQAHLLLQVQITNPINLVETTAFPEEWRIFLRWALAEDISTGQPESIMNRCSQMAAKYRAMLEDWDVEDAPTSFAPDQRGGYASGRFR